MSAVALSPPTNLIPRFALFIAAVKRAIGEGIGRRHDTLGPLSILLETYLSATLRRLTALHARFAAGKLPAAPRARRPAAERAVRERTRPERRPPAIPRGPVLLTVFRASFDEQLRTLLDDPEMRALIAASPRAGRLLRPLWRKLSVDPLPEVLRLPRFKPAAGPPGLRPVVSPNGFIQWEPTPCFPALGAPPRPKPAPATTKPVAPIAAPPPTAPPPTAPPPDWGRPPVPTAAPRPPVSSWVMLLFER
jgi:hypothetical protein